MTMATENLSLGVLKYIQSDPCLFFLCCELNPGLHMCKTCVLFCHWASWLALRSQGLFFYFVKQYLVKFDVCVCAHRHMYTLYFVKKKCSYWALTVDCPSSCGMWECCFCSVLTSVTDGSRPINLHYLLIRSVLLFVAFVAFTLWIMFSYFFISSSVSFSNLEFQKALLFFNCIC